MPPFLQQGIPGDNQPFLQPQTTAGQTGQSVQSWINRLSRPWRLFFTYLSENITNAGPGGTAGSVGPPSTGGSVQYRQGNAVAGDANLTWDKTAQTETIKTIDGSTAIRTIPQTQYPTALGGSNQGFSVGSHQVAGTEIADETRQGYAFFAPVSVSDGTSGMGFSWGETPGSPTTYTNFIELDIHQAGPVIIGSAFNGEQPILIASQIAARLLAGF